MADTAQIGIDSLDRWIRSSGWIGFDPFDGLSAPYARRLTMEVPLLRILLQQSVRRLPINLRPALGITEKHSTKAMGYFAAGYLRLYRLTGQQDYLDTAIYCLADLKEDFSESYAGHAWGNAFDYQSRGAYFPKDLPTVVWTSFIGHAFVDAYELLADSTHLDVARSACEFILRDLGREQMSEESLCISYVPNQQLNIHNANVLGASLLSRVYQHTHEPELVDLARLAIRYTLDHQRADGSWYYGEGLRWRWVDGYHTGFVLDGLYWHMQGSGDDYCESYISTGMHYYRRYLFHGVLPKHYSSSTYPIDIQAVAQAIQTFALIPGKYYGDLAWSEQVATWAIEHMQDASGYFYFRKHRLLLNKTPCLHWGQSTMLAALSLLLLHKAGAPGQADSTNATGESLGRTE